MCKDISRQDGDGDVCQGRPELRFPILCRSSIGTRWRNSCSAFRRRGSSSLGQMFPQSESAKWKRRKRSGAVIEERNARENLRERASYYLLAQFIPGEVFHVDSIVDDGRVQFVGANRYGRPPLEVAHGGGAYVSRTVARGSENEKKLLANNRKLIKALKLERGAAHAEFIKSDADGQFYFLEIAARVGGAYIAEVLEAATGINLWREWARHGSGYRSAGADGRSRAEADRKGEQGLANSSNRGKNMPVSCSHFQSRKPLTRLLTTIQRSSIA